MENSYVIFMQFFKSGNLLETYIKIILKWIWKLSLVWTELMWF